MQPACGCCIPLQPVLMLVLHDQLQVTRTAGAFLPSASTHTALAAMVIVTFCNLYWWCFSCIACTTSLFTVPMNVHTCKCIMHILQLALCAGGGICMQWWWLPCFRMAIHDNIPNLPCKHLTYLPGTGVHTLYTHKRTHTQPNVQLPLMASSKWMSQQVSGAPYKCYICS